MVPKIDLHGVKHQNVQRKLDTFLTEHMNGNKNSIIIVTGNSVKMKEITKKVLSDYGLSGEPTFLNEGLLEVKLK